MKNKITNYSEYLEMIEKKMTYNSYNVIQSVGLFSLGQTVKVQVDWFKLDKYKARIVSFSKHGNAIFASLRWLGSGSDLYKKVGTLFSIDELIRI